MRFLFLFHFIPMNSSHSLRNAIFYRHSLDRHFNFIATLYLNRFLPQIFISAFSIFVFTLFSIYRLKLPFFLFKIKQYYEILKIESRLTLFHFFFYFYTVFWEIRSTAVWVGAPTLFKFCAIIFSSFQCCFYLLSRESILKPFPHIFTFLFLAHSKFRPFHLSPYLFHSSYTSFGCNLIFFCILVIVLLFSEKNASQKNLFECYSNLKIHTSQDKQE